MPIINVRHNENKMKEKGKKIKHKKKQRSGASQNESVKDKFFRCMFKLGFGH